MNPFSVHSADGQIMEEESPESFLRMFQPERAPDRRTRKLALFRSGLHFFTRRNRAGTLVYSRVPGWPDISLDEFSQWELHTLQIHQSALFRDVNFFSQMLAVNGGIIKVVAVGCDETIVTRVAQATNLETFEIYRGSADHNVQYMVDFMVDIFKDSIHTLKVCAPDQEYLNDLSFVTPAFKELYTTASAANNTSHPGYGVQWDFDGLNRIFRNFRIGSKLELLMLHFEQNIMQATFEGRILRGIGFRRIGIHGNMYNQTGPRHYIIEGETGFGFIKMWPNKLFFQLLVTQEEITACENYVSEETPAALWLCVMDQSLYSRLDESAPSSSKREQAKDGTRRDKDRKVSTGTLNRLILVAQALESEVDGRRQTEISGGKITFSLRMTNMILLVLINALVFTGFGKYQANGDGGYKDLLLTADKWTFNNDVTTDLPSTFALMQLNGQYLAAAITLFLLMTTICLQMVHICRKPSSRITSMFYSFGAVPFSLFVFGLEMHYSTCPWVDDYYIQYSVADMSAQCAINGWALAGIFSLLSCGLFVSEGLITAFFRTEGVIDRHYKDAVL